jgi:hypothetical protein
MQHNITIPNTLFAALILKKHMAALPAAAKVRTYDIDASPFDAATWGPSAFLMGLPSLQQ